MKTYGLEKLSLVDYDGHMCATVFTAGCNFECPFCHNSDLVKVQNLHEIPHDEIFAHLEKRKNIIDSVCISGGEPTLQSDLPEFCKTLKSRGFLVKLDTNGTNFDMLKSLIEQKLVDYVAMDIKNSPRMYEKTAGRKVDLENIKKSVEFLKANKIPYEFRTTLVCDHHDDKSIEEMGKWLQGAQKLFLQHFVDSGSCIENGLQEIDLKTATHFKEILEKYIKSVYLRGY